MRIMALINTGAVVTPEMRDRLNQLWGNRPKHCSVCGSFSWNVEESIAELHLLTTLPQLVSPQVIPLVVITCQTCGNTLLLNALKLGWVPSNSLAGGV
jgi:hypothetical protein